MDTISNLKIGVIGLGFVGGAIYKSFELKDINVVGYDKYKDGGIGSMEECLECDILFLCLPTLFNLDTHQYNKSAIHEVCGVLSDNKYKGIVVIKSTVEPETTGIIADKYTLSLIHNPEFLTARTAFKDFHNQKHIVLGKSEYCSSHQLALIKNFYHRYYREAEISLCTSHESECMKIFVNSFYASKIQLFNEYYLLCQKTGADFDTVRSLMLKNGWINSMHTIVPGTDGQLSYGGACFPKDTNALCSYMKSKNTPHSVLNSVIEERNSMRDDLWK